MLLNPAIMALILVSGLVSLMLLLATGFALRVLGHWDISSGSERQLTLERQTYLIATLLTWAFAAELVSLLLFIYNAARPRVFWMKDTYLELAIIFIADDGRIAAIEKGVPRSLTRIPSPGPVRLVLEINHTEAQGLRHGDRLRWTRDPTPP